MTERERLVRGIIAEGLDVKADDYDAQCEHSGLRGFRSAGPGLRDAATRIRDGRIPLDVDRLRDALALPIAERRT